MVEISSGNLIFSMELEKETLDVYLLHEFMENSFLTPQIIYEIWKTSSQFDVLFSDHTRGKFEPFFFLLTASNSVWMRVMRGEEDVGVVYLSRVIPGFDAWGHFTIWDRRGSGREPLFREIARRVMERYDLRRISAEVPPWQSGVIRFISRLGFTKEGVRREGVLHKDSWRDLDMYGLLRSEIQEDSDGRYAIWEGTLWNSYGDQRTDAAAV